MQNRCEYILQKIDSIEAALILSDRGLPIEWYTRKDTPIDEIVSLSSNLLGIAKELHLFDTKSEGSMVFETNFGALIIRTLDENSLIVLCVTDGYSLLTINRVLEKVFLSANY